MQTSYLNGRPQYGFLPSDDVELVVGVATALDEAAKFSAERLIRGTL